VVASLNDVIGWMKLALMVVGFHGRTQAWLFVLYPHSGPEHSDQAIASAVAETIKSIRSE